MTLTVRRGHDPVDFVFVGSARIVHVSTGKKRLGRIYLELAISCRLAPGGWPVIRLNARLKAA